jgi:hypothetical protein
MGDMGRRPKVILNFLDFFCLMIGVGGACALVMAVIIHRERR